jgi:tetratricopeptide (TPR) repeat protein
VREIYARLGDEVQIGLEGKGFLFLGFPDKPSLAEGIGFKGKETRDSRSIFTFRAAKLGTYDLGFLQQDNAAGKSQRETVRVHVVSDGDFAAAISGQAPAAVALSAGVQGDHAHAERLAGLGERQAALEEFLKGYAEGNWYLNDRIGSLYLDGGDLDAAEKYFAKNVGSPGRAGEAGVLGMVRIALARNDAKGFLAQLKPFLAVQELSIEAELIQAAGLEQRAGAVGVGLELLAEYVRRYPAGRFRDEADWISGQLLELESPWRDITRAREIYRELLRRYPESAFADSARERVRYIEEHFITVR